VSELLVNTVMTWLRSLGPEHPSHRRQDRHEQGAARGRIAAEITTRGGQPATVGEFELVDLRRAGTATISAGRWQGGEILADQDLAAPDK
jgi:hypothetical protein